MNNRAGRHAIAFALSLCILSAGAADSTPVTPHPFRMPTANTKFANITFVVFDTETTGFSPVKDRLVEIGAVKIRNGEVLGERTWLINPQRYIPYYVQEVHHITPEMVRDKPTFAEVYPEFLDFIDGTVLIAHNAPFDVRFIAAEALRNNMPVPKNAVLDSLTLFKRWHPDLPSHTVSSLVELFDIDTEGLNAHRATDDSIFVYRAIQKELELHDAEPRFGEILKTVGNAIRFSENQEH
jgi:DNA polymerase III epsilon subunit family exonuclease